MQEIDKSALTKPKDPDWDLKWLKFIPVLRGILHNHSAVYKKKAYNPG
jgi:hypothetical protein